MDVWFQSLSAAIGLAWLVILIVLPLAFWQLRHVARSPATLAGFVASVIQLLIWLFHHAVSLLTLVPLGGFNPSSIFYIPVVNEILSIASTASYSVTFLALAWLLHRGIPTKPSSP